MRLREGNIEKEKGMTRNMDRTNRLVRSTSMSLGMPLPVLRRKGVMGNYMYIYKTRVSKLVQFRLVSVLALVPGSAPCY